MDTLDATAAYDPYTGSTKQLFSLEGARGILQGTASEAAELARCRQYSGLQGLEQLIRDTEDNPNAPLRCGWRYKKSPGSLCPEISQGALGRSSGPLDSSNPLDILGGGVNWFWDLKAARKQMLTDAASEVKTGDIMKLYDSVCNQDYKGRLGYCTVSNKAIPVTTDGQPYYPTDPLLACPSSQLFTDPSKIPAPSVNNAIASYQQEATRTLASCIDTGVNPSLTRDCLLQAIKNNGCSSEGTLYTSLQSVDANQPRWDANLRTQTSFQMYQSKQGDSGITENLFQRGMSDWNQAVREVARLQSAANNSSDMYTRVAAKDLCTNRGSYDTYNFCAELSESAAIGTVQLTCLQQYWQELNGKPAGLLYPVRQPLDSQLGTINTYGDYKLAVKALKAQTQNTDPVIQRKGIDAFYGVKVPSAPFSPATLSGVTLALWLDAMDSSTITLDGKNGIKAWRDKSGQTRNLIQNESYLRPLYTKSGTYGGIEFSGTNQFLEIPSASDMVRNQFTIFVVERRKATKTENYFLGGTTIGRNSNLVLGYNTDTLGILAFWSNDTTVYVPGFKGTTEPSRLWCFRKPSGAKEIYVNGGPRIANNTNSDSLLSWTGAAVGRYYDRFYNGVMYEILVYPSALSDTDRQKVEGYLAHKWAMVSELPSNHPYKLSAP